VVFLPYGKMRLSENSVEKNILDLRERERGSNRKTEKMA
jgi:hypothetical protein